MTNVNVWVYTYTTYLSPSFSKRTSPKRRKGAQNTFNWCQLLVQLLVSSTLVQLISSGGSQIAGRHAWQSLGLVERKRVNIGFDFQTTGKTLIRLVKAGQLTLDTCCQVGEISSPWVAMPPLKQARWDSFCFQNLPKYHFANISLARSIRAEHGCAVIKDSKGRTGILVVGGTGEKVKEEKTSQQCG